MPVGQILQRLYLREQNEGNNLTNRQQFYLTITALGDQVRLRDLPAFLRVLAFLLLFRAFSSCKIFAKRSTPACIVASNVSCIVSCGWSTFADCGEITTLASLSLGPSLAVSCSSCPLFCFLSPLGVSVNFAAFGL